MQALLWIHWIKVYEERGEVSRGGEERGRASSGQISLMSWRTLWPIGFASLQKSNFFLYSTQYLDTLLSNNRSTACTTTTTTTIRTSTTTLTANVILSKYQIRIIKKDGYFKYTYLTTLANKLSIYSKYIHPISIMKKNKCSDRSMKV